MKKKKLICYSRKGSDDGVPNSTSMPTVTSSSLSGVLYILADVGVLFATWWRTSFVIANTLAIGFPLGFSIGPSLGAFASLYTSCASWAQPLWNGFFFLLTGPKGLISLKDFGQNDVYFLNQIERKIPHASGSKRKKKSMGNGLEQKKILCKELFQNKGKIPSNF